MGRRRYLVTYDIGDDRRRSRVFRVLGDYGDHLQYSVFVCEVNAREKVALEGSLGAELNLREDQVLLVDLGPAENDPEVRISSVGRAFVPSTRVVVV